MSTDRYSFFATSLLLLFLALQTATAAEKNFAGTFNNEELSVKIIPKESGGFTGEIKMGEQSFPLSATVRNDQITGTFMTGEGTFDFTGTIENNTLTLHSDGAVYKLTRRAANPLAKTPAPASNPLTKSTPPGPAKEPGSAPLPAGPSGAAWKSYRHPTGFSMSYPPDWEARNLGAALQMVPPNPASNEKGPTEAYFVTGEGAQGITSAEDPRVLAYLEMQLMQIAPFLRRTGEPEKIRAGATPGILVKWEGTNPDGLKLQAQALSTIMKGFGIGIFAIGETKQIATREKTLRGIFASFAAGEGQKDQQLVGSWKYWSYKGSSSGNYSTEQTRFMALAADGTCAWSSQSESIATVKGRDSLGNETFYGGVAGNRGDADRGTWSAGDGKLYIMWQDGTLGEWTYRVEGVPGSRKLYLLPGTPSAKAEEWMETR